MSMTQFNRHRLCFLTPELALLFSSIRIEVKL